MPKQPSQKPIYVKMFVMLRKGNEEFPLSELMHYKGVEEKSLVQPVPSAADRLSLTLMKYAAAGRRKRLRSQFLEQTLFPEPRNYIE